MRLIDADALKENFPLPCEEWEMKGQQTLWHVREIRKTIDLMPTIDAVPRQKYEEDMENAFAHGYTDSESNFRKMIADGELVEVVRCKDCRFFVDHRCRAVKSISDWRGMYDYCSIGEARIDPDVRAKRDSLGVV